MKITDIRVDRFGVWRDLSLSLHPSGLNVFYGPNEAGKSTLMRCIRSILYGFDRHAAASHDKSAVCDGSLTVEHEGRRCNVRRAWRQATRGLVSVTGLDRDEPAERLLTELLSGVDEKLFNHVFAIGLQELQELATLNDEDIAKHVYGLSLGPDGQQLLDAGEEAHRARERIFDNGTETGELADLLARDDELARELESLASAKERYAELCNRRRDLQTEADDLKERQAGIRSQLRGHLFLERIWAPWNDARSFEDEIDAIPNVAGFPENGPARLDALDQRIAAASESRDALLEKIRELRAQADALRADREIYKHTLTAQSLVDERDWVLAGCQHVTTLESETDEQRAMLDLHLSELGPGWTTERLHAVDSTPAANHRMLTAAQAYQTSLRQRGTLIRRHNGLVKACKRRIAELNEQSSSLAGVPLEQELENTRSRLGELRQLAHLDLREAQLDLQLAGLRQQLARLEGREALPQWVLIMLLLLFLAGSTISAAGFYTGVTMNGVAGACLFLIGLTGLGVGYGMKEHAETAALDDIEQLRTDVRTTEEQLRETRDAIGNATGLAESKSERTEAAPDAGARHAQLIAATAARLSELEQLANTSAMIQTRRRRLSELRLRIRETQRVVGDARQEWCQIVVGIGLPETVKVDEAFATWQRVVEAREAHRRWELAQAEIDRQNASLDNVRCRIEELARCIPAWQIDTEHPPIALDRIAAGLQELDAQRQQRHELLRELRGCRREAANLRKKLHQMRHKRSALLVRGGAANRSEFVERAQAAARRREFQECLALANAELAAAAATEPDLAIVEEDLVGFSADDNSEHIRVLKLEQEDLQTDLQHAFEQLGSVKQSIAELEDDRRATRLRYERSQVRHELKAATRRWLAINLASRAVDTMRGRFERTCQPPTLSAACEFLKQLTRGKYSTIWTPLGKRNLCVDDDRGNTFRVEQLSNGTREQLFLAIRLAMVCEFAREGIELPLVLDDMLVNFDQSRTEAAIETLLHFRDGAQQILLFTCHLHLAQMFQSRGIEPIWLPAHNAVLEERLAG